MGEGHRQLGASSTAPTLDGSWGTTQHGCRLLNGPTLHIDKEDGIALVLWKGGKGRGDSDLILALPDVISWVDECPTGLRVGFGKWKRGSNRPTS